MVLQDTLKKIIRIRPDYTTITLDQITSKEKEPIQIVQEQEILTDNFIDNFNQLINSVNNIEFILPNKCKFVKQYTPSKTMQQFMFIIEEEPTLRTIRVNLPMEAPLERLRLENKLEVYGYKDFELKQLGFPYLFTLAFPYVIHTIILHLYPDTQPQIDHYVFYKLSPLQSTFDYLIRPNLPNIDNNFRVCPGEYELTESTIPGIIQQYLVHFWSSVFNKDYLVHYLSYSKDEIITDFLQWQYHSKQNPKCIFNVGWETCGQLQEKIQRIEQGEHLDQAKLIDLYKLYALATSSKLKFDKKLPKVAFTNWIDSMWIEKKYMLSIGDKLKLNKKVFYVKDFLRDLKQQSFIVIEDLKGKTFRLKETEKLREILLKEYKKQSFEFSATINGETYQQGDTVIVTTPGTNQQQYVTILGFSKTKLGKLLISFHNGNKYFLENVKIQKFNKFDMTLNDIHFEANKKYLFFDKFQLSMSTYRERTFKEAILDYGELALDFTIDSTSGRTRTHRIPLYELARYQIVSVDNPELFQVPALFSFGHMYSSSSSFLSYKGNIYVKDNSNPINCNFESIKQYVNENEINLPDLKPFKVGDQIAIALWNEPLEMIKRRVITRIIIDNEKKEVKIETTDGVTLRQDLFIIKDSIRYASFKHIINEYDGLVGGTVFKPKTSGIPCFPKKSNYKLIGFIESGCSSFPMMALMSNCCTLWSFQLKHDFQQAPNENVENPTIDKIKFQDLDMFNNGYYGYDNGIETSILLYNHNYAGLRNYSVGYIRLSGGIGITTNPKSSSRIGFIYPRKHQYGNNITKFGLISGTYQLHFYQANDAGRYRLIFDRRLFENV